MTMFISSDIDIPELFKPLDAVFVFSFGQLIGQRFLDAPKFGFLNLQFPL